MGGDFNTPVKQSMYAYDGKMLFFSIVVVRSLYLLVYYSSNEIYPKNRTKRLFVGFLRVARGEPLLYYGRGDQERFACSSSRHSPIDFRHGCAGTCVGTDGGHPSLLFPAPRPSRPTPASSRAETHRRAQKTSPTVNRQVTMAYWILFYH